MLPLLIPMTATTIESVATQAALASLNVYRRHLSPRKGFSCPHQLLHMDESCSAYISRILTNQSLSEAIRLAPQRFKDCKAAAQTLSSQRSGGGCIVIPCCIPL